jgi:DNA-binding transcriptional LysR family regulator
MELRHLRYFLGVAETLNFSRAAERLRVAQPALSRQIHDLESELGTRLFERSTTQVTLTPSGAFFRQQVEKILTQVDLAVTGVREIAKGASGTFRIGSDWNASGLPVATAARILAQRHPKLTVDFVELPGHEHIAAVRARKIDIGFIPGLLRGARSDVDYGLISATPFKVILPESHPFAGRKALRVRDLKNERWLFLAEAEVPGFKTLMTQVLRPAQFTPKFGRSARSLAGLLAFIATGEGIAMIPELFLPPAPEGLKYLPVDMTPFELFAVWSKLNPPPLLNAYLELLRNRSTTTTTAVER